MCPSPVNTVLSTGTFGTGFYLYKRKITNRSVMKFTDKNDVLAKEEQLRGVISKMARSKTVTGGAVGLPRIQMGSMVILRMTQVISCDSA